MSEQIRVGILGASGYTGQELVRLLLLHPHVKISALVSSTYAGQLYSSVFPSFSGMLDQAFVSADDPEQFADNCDLLFVALPHAEAAKRIELDSLTRVKIIDLSADFRLKEPSLYDMWYGFQHPNPQLLAKSVYGLPEWRRAEIAGARLVANPGCYATCTLLSLMPLAAASLLSDEPVIVDAKSGVSGAGRSLDIATHFIECNESIKAYKIASHRHIPEIEQELSTAGGAVSIVFTPHLIPISRGILTTSYCTLRESISAEDLFDIYKSKYVSEPFVKLIPSGSPETRWVKGSNFCQIGITVDPRTKRVIVVGAVDNLVKGAAGQAIQNMNIMFDIAETTGLLQTALCP